MTTDTPKTFGEIEREEGIKLNHRATPIPSTTAFENYLSDLYIYAGASYKPNTTNEYKVIFNGTKYWLSSKCAIVMAASSLVYYRISFVTSVEIGTFSVCDSRTNWGGSYSSEKLALRPVVVLEPNVQFVKNQAGEWTLEAM